MGGHSVSWDRSANGYCLPTEEEWNMSAAPVQPTPFYMTSSLSAEKSNYYGHYLYQIGDNYFSYYNLEVQLGEYRKMTVPVDSFSENSYGLYNVHDNVSEWVWDYCGEFC